MSHNLTAQKEPQFVSWNSEVLEHVQNGKEAALLCPFGESRRNHVQDEIERNLLLLTCLVKIRLPMFSRHSTDIVLALQSLEHDSGWGKRYQIPHAHSSAILTPKPQAGSFREKPWAPCRGRWSLSCISWVFNAQWSSRPLQSLELSLTLTFISSFLWSLKHHSFATYCVLAQNKTSTNSFRYVCQWRWELKGSRERVQKA